MGIRGRRNSEIKQPWQNALPLVPWDTNLGCISKRVGYLNNAQVWNKHMEGICFLLVLCYIGWGFVVSHATVWTLHTRTCWEFQIQWKKLSIEIIANDCVYSRRVSPMTFLPHLWLYFYLLFTYFIHKDIHITLHSI